MNDYNVYNKTDAFLLTNICGSFSYLNHAFYEKNIDLQEFMACHCLGN